MAVAGVVLKKIAMEKTGALKGKLSITNNALIKNVEKAELSLGNMKRPAARFSFEYITNYEPKVASFTFAGQVVWTDEEKAIEDILKGWEKDRKVPTAVAAAVLNTVFNKCGVAAILLSRELNLPSPIQLPRVKGE
jgi:hypothetical protein